MRSRLLAFGVVLALASPAWAAREWYESYDDARRKLIPAKRYAEAIAALKEAVRVRPDPGVDVRTYGMGTIDYFPYYYMGVCYQATGDLQNALTAFNIEESRGFIKKKDEYKDLSRRRAEAQAAIDSSDRRQAAERARADVEAAMKEAESLEKAHRFEDALGRLNYAGAAAQLLDARTQRAIADAAERVKREQQDLAETTARDKRIEQGLLEGARLMGESKWTEASTRFADVLSVDPRNAKALEGKKRTEDLILATTTRRNREKDLQDGKAFVEAGEYAQAIGPLTNAAVDIPEAADLLKRAQKMREGLTKERENQAEIGRLYKQGEELVAAREYEKAQVSFDGILRLDPEQAKAKERLDFAREKTVEAAFAKYQRDERPTLTFIKPDGNSEVDGPTVSVLGAAGDDRGIQKIEFHLGGKMVAEIKPAPRLDTGEANESSSSSTASSPSSRAPTSSWSRSSTSAASPTPRPSPSTGGSASTRRGPSYPSALAGAVGLMGMGALAARLRRRRAVRRRFNPYIAGAPVLDDDMFFGRQKLMSRMLNVLHHNSLMITGERRIGKTTFLYHLKKVLAADEGSEFQFFPVFTDLQGVPESAFFHAVMADVLDGLRPSPDTQAALRFGREPQGYEASASTPPSRSPPTRSTACIRRRKRTTGS